MEKMYEVLRFVEKGTECQPGIDCLQGELLIYYLRDNTQLDKAVLFEWFRQIAGEIRKYQQSRRGQNYRCLTPYSIVVTEEGELLLLNPDAQENEFVIKKMQQKAVRSHFIRPTASGSRKNCSVDLFGYGKILQFLLAYTEQIPELSRSEERRLERIIERCTGGGRRHYDKISQVIRDLPEEREEWNLEQKVKFRNVKLAVLLFAAGAVIAAAGIGMSRGRESNNTVGKSETAVQAQKADDVKTIPEEHSETEQERKKALEDMKWKKEMEERVQEILESVKACEKKIEETTKEENNGENKEETEQTTEQQTEETVEKSVEEEIQQETKQEVINDPVVPE